MDRRRDLVNFSERRTHLLLDDVASANGRSTCLKVRMADALKIEGSGLSDDEFRYALQAHFDFVVVSGHRRRVEFAVEFDGPGHFNDERARRNHLLKDAICAKLGMPLFRLDEAVLTTRVGSCSAFEWLLRVGFQTDDATFPAAESGIIDARDTIAVDHDGRLVWPNNPTHGCGDRIRAQAAAGRCSSRWFNLTGTKAPGQQLSCLTLCQREPALDSSVQEWFFGGASVPEFTYGAVTPKEFAETLALRNLADNIDDGERFVPPSEVRRWVATMDVRPCVVEGMGDEPLVVAMRWRNNKPPLP